jgi:hypothetical protein
VLWRRLRFGLQQIESGASSVLDEAPTRRFIALNRGHLEFENVHVLPLARQVLGADELEGLGRAMAARRNVPFAA